VASSIIGPVDELFTQLFANQSAALDQKTEKEKLAVENSVLSESDKAKKLKAIDEKAAKERAAIARKTAIQNKVLGIFNATVSMFEGVAKALALGPVGLPLVPLIKALGLVNIAAIASAPLPSLAIGTNYVKSCPQSCTKESVVPARVMVTTPKVNAWQNK
jgi:hypothetical protein